VNESRHLDSFPQILGWREGAAGHSGSVTWATVFEDYSPFTAPHSKTDKHRSKSLLLDSNHHHTSSSPDAAAL